MMMLKSESNHLYFIPLLQNRIYFWLLEMQYWNKLYQLEYWNHYLITDYSYFFIKSITNSRRGRLKYRDHPVCNMLQHSCSCCLPLSLELNYTSSTRNLWLILTSRVHSSSVNFNVFLRTPESQTANKHTKRRWRRVSFSEYPLSQSKRVPLMGSVLDTGNHPKWDICPFLQILQAFSPKSTPLGLHCCAQNLNRLPIVL